jgi:hypothetical protein
MQRRQQTPQRFPEMTPGTTSGPKQSLPVRLPVPHDNNTRAQSSQSVKVPSGYASFHNDLPCAKLFTLDASAQDSLNDTDFNQDMRPDEGKNTWRYTIC